jgi:hypothetical protein
VRSLHYCVPHFSGHIRNHSPGLESTKNRFHPKGGWRMFYMNWAYLVLVRRGEEESKGK